MKRRANGRWLLSALALAAIPGLAGPADVAAAEAGDGQSALERARTTAVPLLLHVEPPRDSARHLGDVVTYRALLAWPTGWEIDRDGIPVPVPDTAPIELHGHSVSPAPDQCPNCRWLNLDWQVFKAVRMTEDLLLPSPAVRFRRDTQIATVELPPTVLAVSPLVPWERRKNWADSMRRGWEPFLLDPSRLWRQAGLAAAVALLALLGWGWASGRWFVRRRARPFARAWRAVAGRRTGAGEPADADDLRHWHRAFDATAGETVVPGRLDEFLAAHSQYAVLANDIRDIFEASRRHFFTDTGPPSARLPRVTLIVVLRQLADIEFRPGPSAGVGLRERAATSSSSSHAAV